jgi:hypothetical protein
MTAAVIVRKVPGAFEKLVGDLSAKPSRERQSTAEFAMRLQQGRDAVLQGRMSTEALTSLERLLERGEPLPDKIKAALDAVPRIGL